MQHATGATHLQQLEMRPEAFGLNKSIRPHVKQLRHKRNKALHGVFNASQEAEKHERKVNRTDLEKEDSEGFKTMPHSGIAEPTCEADAECCPSIDRGGHPLGTIEELAQQLVKLSLALSPPYESGEDDESDNTGHAGGN